MDKQDIVDYAKNYLGDDKDDTLINNAEIWDCEDGRRLTIGDVVELQLLINPLDSTVFELKDGKLVRNERYNYTSY